MQKTIRAFVAVPVPEAVVAFLQQIQVQLQLTGTTIRWVAAKNIHLTLKFLGDIDPSRVASVAAQMDQAAGTITPISLVAKGVGVFPHLRNARVIWVGLAGETDRLTVIQATLDAGLETVGFKRESRSFGAHLTIGRIRQRIDGRLIGASLDPLKDAASDVFRVDRLMLFKSVLKPSGPEYSLLHKSNLAVMEPLGSS